MIIKVKEKERREPVFLKNKIFFNHRKWSEDNCVSIERRTIESNKKLFK